MRKRRLALHGAAAFLIAMFMYKHNDIYHFASHGEQHFINGKNEPSFTL